MTFFATFLCLSLLGLGCVYLKKQDLSFKLACAVSKVTFSSLEDSTEGRSTTYKLFGTRISTHLLALSFMVTSATLACAAVVAWEVFLLEESDNCDSGFDCFDDAVESNTSRTVTISSVEMSAVTSSSTGSTWPSEQ